MIRNNTIALIQFRDIRHHMVNICFYTYVFKNFKIIEVTLKCRIFCIYHQGGEIAKEFKEVYLQIATIRMP